MNTPSKSQRQRQAGLKAWLNPARMAQNAEAKIPSSAAHDNSMEVAYDDLSSANSVEGGEGFTKVKGRKRGASKRGSDDDSDTGSQRSMSTRSSKISKRSGNTITPSDNESTTTKNGSRSSNGKSRSVKSRSSKTKDSVKSSNRFDPIKDLVDEQADDVTAKIKQKGSEDVTKTKTKPTKPTIAPVNVRIDELNFPYSLLESLLKKLKFRPVVYKKAGGFMAVHVATLDDYRLLLSELEAQKFYFYLFNSPETTPPIKLVIRGLPSNMPKEEIIEKLTEQNVTPIDVAQMRKGGSKLGAPLPLYLLTIPNDKNAKNIKSIAAIGFIKVRFEPFKKPNRPVQCFKCQGFDHVSKFCFLAVRCVKCGEAHSSQNCPKPATKESIKCANCDKKHTANYKGCETYMALCQRYKRKNKTSDGKKNNEKDGVQKPSLDETHFPSLSTAAGKPLQNDPPVKTSNISKQRKSMTARPYSQAVRTPQSQIHDPEFPVEVADALMKTLSDSIKLTTAIANRQISMSQARTKTAEIIQQLFDCAFKERYYKDLQFQNASTP